MRPSVFETYTGQGVTAVTALGGSAALLDVQNPRLATRSLHDSREVRGGVVAIKSRSVIWSPLPDSADFNFHLSSVEDPSFH